MWVSTSIDAWWGVGTHYCGQQAQLVEQRTLNPLVVGSTPTLPTRFLSSGFLKTEYHRDMRRIHHLFYAHVWG